MLLILLLLGAVFLIVYSTTRWSLHPFLALLFVAILFGLLSGMPVQTLLTSINEGFGSLLGNIGLVIVLGVIIGTFLEKTGAAVRMASTMLKLTGEKRVPESLALMGWVISIPVFADSGFVILSSLTKALTKRAGLSIGVTAVCLSMGLMATHVMVPPTPGPIAAASILGAELGLVIIYGIQTSLFALIPTVYFAKKYFANIQVAEDNSIDNADFETTLKTAPSLIKSLLPVLFPLVFIVIKSFNTYYSWTVSGGLFNVIEFLGTPVIALLMGMLLAFLLPKKLEKSMLSSSGWVGQSLLDAASIVLITGAGGVFGKVLQNAGLGNVLGAVLADYPVGIFLPFLLAAAIKSAQGSSTVAMITTASIIAPLLPSLGLDSPLAAALVVLALGAGGAVFSHVNDSFFWVVTQLTGMNISQGLRTHSRASAILGFSAFVYIFFIWLFFV